MDTGLYALKNGLQDWVKSSNLSRMSRIEFANLIVEVVVVGIASTFVLTALSSGLMDKSSMEPFKKDAMILPTLFFIIYLPTYYLSNISYSPRYFVIDIISTAATLAVYISAFAFIYLPFEWIFGGFYEQFIGKVITVHLFVFCFITSKKYIEVIYTVFKRLCGFVNMLYVDFGGVKRWSAKQSVIWTIIAPILQIVAIFVFVEILNIFGTETIKTISLQIESTPFVQNMVESRPLNEEIVGNDTTWQAEPPVERDYRELDSGFINDTKGIIIGICSSIVAVPYMVRIKQTMFFIHNHSLYKIPAYLTIVFAPFMFAALSPSDTAFIATLIIFVPAMYALMMWNLYSDWAKDKLEYCWDWCESH